MAKLLSKRRSAATAGTEPRGLVACTYDNTRTLTHLPEYKELWRRLRELPEFRRIAAASYPEGKPAPSFVFQVQHSALGRLALRTATTVFTVRITMLPTSSNKALVGKNASSATPRTIAC